MPHSIDFDGLERKLFILQHICYASRQFCEKHGINRLEFDSSDFEWWEYSGLLKVIVSNTIIEVAIKIRMLQDFLQTDDYGANLDKLDTNARHNLKIGLFSKGSGNLTLRESCNKVIHATEARLQWINIDDDENLPEYWNGRYDLWGSNRGKEWQVELDVEAWCRSMIRFNKAIQESVDWYHVFKHDE